MQKEQWEGHEKIVFEVNGRESYIVLPETQAEGKPWVWRAEYFGAFDTVDRALLGLGWTLAYHKASDMFGSPDAVASMKDFHDFVCKEFGLAEKAVILGFSVGGLYTFNYGNTYPEDTAALYLDAPATNLVLFSRKESDWTNVSNAYHTPLDELLETKQSPNDKAFEFGAKGVPVILVAGLLDTAAIYSENGEIFVERFRDGGGEIHTILKPDCAHHPHSLEDPAPIVDWILAHTVK